MLQNVGGTVVHKESAIGVRSYDSSEVAASKMSGLP
jgi:hypothetical protein